MIITCPHCDETVIIEKLNCGIFIHGVIKKTGKQIPPHLSKTKCMKLIDKNLIYGCGKQFHIVNNQAIKM
jgi:hypothetical protein